MLSAVLVHDASARSACPRMYWLAPVPTIVYLFSADLKTRPASLRPAEKTLSSPPILFFRPPHFILRSQVLY